MTTTPEKLCGTGATSGSPAWNDPNKITTELAGGFEAYISASVFVAPIVSGELRATNFGFAASGVGPVDTIDGVEMRFKRAAAKTGNNDSVIKLFWSGAAQGSDQSLGPDWPSPTGGWAYASYGGAADTWGASPTGAIVRTSGFGCVIQAERLGVSNSLVQVDVVRMTVHYTQVALGIGFLAQVIGVLPALIQSLIMPFISRKRSVECSAGSVS